LGRHSRGFGVLEDGFHVSPIRIGYDGKPFTTNYRYIDVYVRKDGRWRIASVQITRLKT
jgi:hypothetical protein